MAAKAHAVKRLLWIDISKGLAILFVAYFHFFSTYFQHGVLPPPDWSNLGASALTFLRLAWFKVSGLGFHAVGVFIILSGWTLMQSTVRRAEKGEIAWGAWYRARFLRLYPMYWVAHLVYLVSPFIARLEPVDDRIILSLLGLRFINIEMNFMYLNAAWWYVSMLIQFYLIFPLQDFLRATSCSSSGRKMDCGYSAVSQFVVCRNLRSGCRWQCGMRNRPRVWNGSFFAARGS